MSDLKEKDSDVQKLAKMQNTHKKSNSYIPRKIAREKMQDSLSSCMKFITGLPNDFSIVHERVVEHIPNMVRQVTNRREYAREQLPLKIQNIYKFVGRSFENFSSSFDTASHGMKKIHKIVKHRVRDSREKLREKVVAIANLFPEAHGIMQDNWRSMDFAYNLSKNLEFAREGAEISMIKQRTEVRKKIERQDNRSEIIQEKKESVQNFFGSVSDNLANSTASAMSKLQSKLQIMLAESVKKNILEASPPKKIQKEVVKTISPSPSNNFTIPLIGSNMATKNSIHSNSPTIQLEDMPNQESPTTKNVNLQTDSKRTRIQAGKAASTSIPKAYNDFEAQTGNGTILEKHLRSKKENKLLDSEFGERSAPFQKYDSMKEIEFKSSPQKRQNHSTRKDIPHLPNLEDLERDRQAERLREKERLLRIGFEKNLSDAISKQITHERRNVDYLTSGRSRPQKVKHEDEDAQAVRYYFEFKRRVKQKVMFHEISQDNNASHAGSSVLMTDNSLPPISHVRDFSDDIRSYRRPKKMLDGSPQIFRAAPYSTRKRSNPSADMMLDSPLDRSNLNNLSNISYFDTPEVSNKKKYHINSPTPIRSNNIEFEFYTPPKIVTHDMKHPGYPALSDKKAKFEAEIPRYFNKPLNYSPFDPAPRKPFVPKREDYLPRKHVSKWKVNNQGQVIGYNDIVRQKEAKAVYDQKLKQEIMMWAQ